MVLHVAYLFLHFSDTFIQSNLERQNTIRRLQHCATSQLHNSRYIPRLLSVRRFARSPCICMGFLCILWFPPTTQKHGSWGIGYTTFLGVNVYMPLFNRLLSHPWCVPACGSTTNLAGFKSLLKINKLMHLFTDS